MDKAVQRAVRDRAGNRCEYCCFPEALAELPFHIDHIVAEQHGGQSTLENLALSCCYCNRYKGPNLSGIDPNSGKIVALFHPRQQIWTRHFSWDGTQLRGKTAAGRATIQVLQINRPEAVAVRQLLMHEGAF